MSADNPTFAEKALEVTEKQRKLDGVLSIEDFGWIHLPCDGVVVQNLPPLNSDKVDPATADMLPVFRSRLHCNKHNVSSLPEEV